MLYRRYEVRGSGFVKISTDGGESWFIPDAANMEFSGVSPDYPEMTRTNLNLGRAYAGQAVLVRFQANLYYMATPHDAIESGWAIGVEFRGIDNRRLLAVVPHPNDGQVLLLEKCYENTTILYDYADGAQPECRVCSSSGDAGQAHL